MTVRCKKCHHEIKNGALDACSWCKELRYPMKIYEYELVATTDATHALCVTNDLASEGWRVIQHSVADSWHFWAMEREVPQPTKKVEPTKMPSHGASR